MGSAADRLTGGDAGIAGQIDMSAFRLDDLLACAGRETTVARLLRHALPADADQVLSAFGSYADDEPDA